MGGITQAHGLFEVFDGDHAWVAWFAVVAVLFHIAVLGFGFLALYRGGGADAGIRKFKDE